MSQPWEHVTLTLKPDQVRLIKAILEGEYLHAKMEYDDGGKHAKAVDEVLVSLNEQFTE